MNMEYIIVQAGGKGSRLNQLTKNKPKALVPVENLPVLFHLFRKFSDKSYIVIADYKKEVMRAYLSAFAQVKYQVVNAHGDGTCAGIKQAVDLIPDDVPFMLIWSDLILSDDFVIPDHKGDYIGISQTFPCRWKYDKGKFEEECSSQYGVAGVFIFRDKSYIKNAPQRGELVRHFQEQHLTFTPLDLGKTREIGTLEEYRKIEAVKTRPFNRLTIVGNKVIKEPLDSQGQELAVLEGNWYAYAKEHCFTAIPKISGTSPLIMEHISGKNIYEYEDLTIGQKHKILQRLIDSLKQLHALETVPVDSFSLKEAYYGKTIRRLQKVHDLIPMANYPIITINGRKCRNIYFYKREFERLIDEIHCDRFTFIHGDCTFSNLMLKNTGEPVFIDPRGYFGHTALFGDPCYDWAKLYYSIVGNYDQFNRRNFSLSIDENAVVLQIASNHWEVLEDTFFTLSGVDQRTVSLLHAVIWLSLTTYAWHDYDSVCGAFYNGLYYLEECWP